MFSKFSRIGSEPVKWQFTITITRLSLPSLKSACVVVSRGDSKVSTPYTEPVKGYFLYPEPLTLTCTLYRKRDKGGNGVYLPKEGEVRVLEKGKAKEAGVVAIDFSEYVSESRSEVESADNNWRIEKAADKYNNFMLVNISARKLGPGGPEEGTAAVETKGKEEVKEAEEEEDEEDEAEKEEREWKKRNALPASKGKPNDARKKFREEEEEEEEAEDEDDEPLEEEEEEESPKKKPASSSAAAARAKAKAAAAHEPEHSDEWSEDEDEIIARLKGLKADGKLAPVSKQPVVPAAGKGGAKVEERKEAAAVKSRPAAGKKDKSAMTAKELLFADSSDDEEQVKPKRAAVGKAAAAALKPVAGKDKEDKAKSTSKPASKPAAGGSAKTPSWEVTIPTASSASSSPTASSSAKPAATALAAATPATAIAASRLFSCTLPEANTVYPASIKSPPAVPYILTFLLQQLEKHNALLAPQLFKQYVDPSAVTALRGQLEQGTWKLKGSHADDPHALGGVLKLWVGGLQDGLVGESLVADVLSVGMMEGEEDEDVQDAVTKVTKRLPPLHRTTLLTLLQFLKTMLLPLNARKNGMKIESIASAWGAAVVRMKADPKKSAYDQFSDKANVNRFVQYAMQHLDAVKAAGGTGAAAGGAPGGKPMAAAARHEEEEEEEEGEAEDEVVKEEEDEEAEEEAVHDESDGEATGLKFHPDHDEEEEEEKPKAKGKALTARERLEQEKQEREKQKAEKEAKEKADKAKVEKDKVDKAKAEKERLDKLERERKAAEQERRDREEKERKEKERREREEKDRREREERERQEKAKASAGKKVGAAAAASFKPANVFGDSDLDEDDEDGEQVRDDDENEAHEEDDEAEEEEEEEVKTIQPKGKPASRPTSPVVVSSSAAGASSKADRELISRQQAELDSLRKQLADAQSKQSSTSRASTNSGSADEVSELKSKLVVALKEKDAAQKEKREGDKRLLAFEAERESQKRMVEKLQKLLVAKGKIDAAQLSELSDASKGRASPAPPPPPPAGGVGGIKLSEHLGVLQLKYDALVEEMEQKLANERHIRKQLKQQLEQLTEENSNLRQRSMHFDQLVMTGANPAAVASPNAAQQGNKKTRDELLGVVAQQYERISFLEHTMRENEAMMRAAKQAWIDSARIMEDEMEHKDDELRRMKEGYEQAVQQKGVEWVGEEEWRKRVERLRREKDKCERERKEMEDEVRGKRVELQEAMKSVVQLEDDTRVLKEELTRTGIALKTIAEDNFELKEWMRLHSKGKKG